MEKTKLLHKICAGRKNVRANELRKLMGLFGFEYRKTKHAIQYTHHSLPKLYPIYVVEHREKGQENKVLVRYVNKCITAIEELLLMEGGGEDD